MSEVPSASAPSRTARCEMDFSPGVRTLPRHGTPPVTTRMRGGRHRQVLGAAPVAVRLDGRRQGVGVGAVDDEDQHATWALRRVRDLDVVDPDARIGGERGDLGQHAGTVGDRDAQLGQVVGPHDAGREVPPGRAGPLERAEERVAVVRGHPVPHSRRSLTNASSASTMGRALSAQMSGQMPGCPAATRVMSRKPPAARRSRAPSCSAPALAAFIRVAATRWGTWETTATSRSWSSAESTRTSAPRLSTTPRSRSKAPRSVAGVGVRTQTARRRGRGRPRAARPARTRPWGARR